MTPTAQQIDALIATNQLGRALRGELCVFTTPAEINDDMRPTDHDELLSKGIYPLVPLHGPGVIINSVEEALVAICHDALGVFCAHQCYYIEIIREHGRQSPIAIDRERLPKLLAQAFLQQTPGLHQLELRGGDVLVDRSYKVVLSGMRILARDHGIDWGITLPTI